MIELNEKDKERLFEVFIGELDKIIGEKEELMKKQSKFNIKNNKVCFETDNEKGGK